MNVEHLYYFNDLTRDPSHVKGACSLPAAELDIGQGWGAEVLGCSSPEHEEPGWSLSECPASAPLGSCSRWSKKAISEVSSCVTNSPYEAKKVTTGELQTIINPISMCLPTLFLTWHIMWNDTVIVCTNEWSDVRTQGIWPCFLSNKAVE